MRELSVLCVLLIILQSAIAITARTTTNLSPQKINTACWDLNENGIKDFPDEDINGDSKINTKDCNEPNNITVNNLTAKEIATSKLIIDGQSIIFNTSGPTRVTLPTEGTLITDAVANILGNRIKSLEAITSTLQNGLNASNTNISKNTSNINPLQSIIDAATQDNTENTLVKRDANGDFIARKITATLNGNALTATNASTAGSIVNGANGLTLTGGQLITFITSGPTNITLPTGGTLINDTVTNALDTRVISLESTTSTLRNALNASNSNIATNTSSINSLQTSMTNNTNTVSSFQASLTANTSSITSLQSSLTTNTNNISSLQSTVNAATNNNSENTLVKRDANGDFTARKITATLNGNALTATTATNAINANHALTATTATDAITAGYALTADTATTAQSLLNGQNSLTLSGNKTIVLNTTGPTNVTLPTSGTLVSTDSLTPLAMGGTIDVEGRTSFDVTGVNFIRIIDSNTSSNDTISTITGGVAGQRLIIVVQIPSGSAAGMKITDDGSASNANTINVDNAIPSKLDAYDVLELIYDGTKWYLLSVSNNN